MNIIRRLNIFLRNRCLTKKKNDNHVSRKVHQITYCHCIVHFFFSCNVFYLCYTGTYVCTFLYILKDGRIKRGHYTQGHIERPLSCHLQFGLNITFVNNNSKNTITDQNIPSPTQSNPNSIPKSIFYTKRNKKKMQ